MHSSTWEAEARGYQVLGQCGQLDRSCFIQQGCGWESVGTAGDLGGVHSRACLAVQVTLKVNHTLFQVVPLPGTVCVRTEGLELKFYALISHIHLHAKLFTAC